MDKKIDRKLKTMKHLEKAQEKNFHKFGCGKYFLDTTPKHDA